MDHSPETLANRIEEFAATVNDEMDTVRHRWDELAERISTLETKLLETARNAEYDETYLRGRIDDLDRKLGDMNRTVEDLSRKVEYR